MTKRRSDYGDASDTAPNPNVAQASPTGSSSGEDPGGSSTPSSSDPAFSETDPAQLAESDPPPVPPPPESPVPPPPEPEPTPEAASSAEPPPGPPRAAPKAGEGVNPEPRASPHPELEPPTPPTELRVAPPAPEDVEREPYGDRPTYDDLLSATNVHVRTLDAKSAGVYVAGELITRETRTIPIAQILARSDAHLVQLAADPRIEVELVD